MWREKLIELKRASGLTVKQISEKARMSEKTVTRILSGETDRPYMDHLYDIVSALGGSLDDLFAEGTRAQLSNGELSAALDKVEKLSSENNRLIEEIIFCQEKITLLKHEIEILGIKLEHKEEISKQKDDLIALLKTKL